MDLMALISIMTNVQNEGRIREIHNNYQYLDTNN